MISLESFLNAYHQLGISRVKSDDFMINVVNESGEQD